MTANLDTFGAPGHDDAEARSTPEGYMSPSDRMMSELRPGTPVRNPETRERGIYHGESPAAAYSHVVTIPSVGITGLDVTSLKNWKTIELDPDGCVFDWARPPAPDGTEWRLVGNDLHGHLMTTGTGSWDASWDASLDAQYVLRSQYKQLNLEPAPVAPEFKPRMWLRAERSPESEVFWLHEILSNGDWVIWSTCIDDDWAWTRSGGLAPSMVTPHKEIYSGTKPVWGDHLMALLGVGEQS